MASPQAHRSDARILGRRTLARDHGHLALLLRPGHRVLDVGCGTGAITEGIAAAVAPGGFAFGIDRDAILLDTARRERAAVPHLFFALADAAALPFHACFDVVTAARTLQWVAQPADALRAMRDAAKPGGTVVVLDYDHTACLWEPDPPAEFQHFYRAFLAWREAHGWDNRLAANLPELFRSTGLTGVESYAADEAAARGEECFAEAASLWPHVVESLGARIAAEGFLDRSRVPALADRCAAWGRTELMRQTLSLRAAVGRV